MCILGSVLVTGTLAVTYVLGSGAASDSANDSIVTQQAQETTSSESREPEFDLSGNEVENFQTSTVSVDGDVTWQMT